MQRKQVEPTYTINPKYTDAKMYGILLFVCLILMEFITLFFIRPVSKSILLNFSDVYYYTLAGYADSRVVYSNLLSMGSCASQCVGYVAIISLALGTSLEIFRRDAFNFKYKKKRYIKVILLGLACLFGSNFVLNLIYTFVTNGSTSANQLTIYGLLNSSMLPLTILLAVVLAPIVEELIFRKYMVGFLNETIHLPLWASGVISALLFGLIHCLSGIEQLVYLPQYAVMGGILVGVYLLTDKNIYASTIVHMVNNILSVLLWALSLLM